MTSVHGHVGFKRCRGGNNQRVQLRGTSIRAIGVTTGDKKGKCFVSSQHQGRVCIQHVVEPFPH